MKPNIYVNFSEVDELQTKIMHCVDNWVHKEKVPVPFTEIIKKMQAAGIKKPTIKAAIYVLIKKGYIRRSYAVSSRAKTSYVQLRRV